MRPRIDINCDLGESYGAFKVGSDEEIMPHITSANVACGFHAGDPTTMKRTVGTAKKHGVAVGAHPGFPDLMGFGRREMQLTHEELTDLMIYQMGALQAFAKAAGVVLQHLKPHGALYNMAAKDESVAEPVVEAARVSDAKLIVLAPPGSVLAEAAVRAGLRVAFEVFADRTYNSDGSLVSRKQSNAIICEPREVVERAVKMVMEKSVVAADGKVVGFGEVHTICVHGDTMGAVKLAETLKKGLLRAGVKVESLDRFV